MPVFLKKVTDSFNRLVIPKRVDGKRYSLMEHVIHNTFLLVASLLAFVSTIFNLFELGDIILTIYTGAFSVIFVFVYYRSRYKGYHNVWLTLITALSFLSVLWFLNGGALGSIPYVYILALIFLVFIINRQQTNLVFILFTLNIILLLIIESVWGEELVHPYPSLSSQYTDIAFVLIMVLIFSFLVLRFFKFMYEGEKAKVENQKKIIEKQNEEHLSSLSYASNLQRMIISDEEQLQFLFNDFFVLFKPKDIVSGDFYWVKQWEEIGIVVVADCTGHGVPAALLSILGISLLEETFEQLKLKEWEYDAAEFLEVLRIKFFRYMKKKGVSEVLQDSMDLGIVIINYKESTVQFSGANRSMIILRDNQYIHEELIEKDLASSTHTLYSYPATKNTIGYNYIEQPFINHIIDYYHGDTLYIFTDGYGDQFDAENKKKFKLGRMKEELLNIQNLPMSEQSNYLKNLYQEWKGETEQTDDILIVGMRV